MRNDKGGKMSGDEYVDGSRCDCGNKLISKMEMIEVWYCPKCNTEEKVREHIDSVLPEVGHWYCSTCKERKEPIEVTYEENCVDCGTAVMFVTG